MPENLTAFMELGLTALEAEVYAHLLQNSPSTGYRVAQFLGKPAANVYKSLESLETKGAVLIERGANRSCRAVPVDELLRHLDSQFRARQEAALRVAAALKAPAEDEHVYQLRSYDQVLARARAMLSRARKTALLDIFPAPLALLQPNIEAAAARSVQVSLKAYLPVTVEGVPAVLNPQGERLMEQYPGSWIILLIDGSELLIASLSPADREVQQAIWTDSVIVAWIFHCALAAEIMFASLCAHIHRGATAEELQGAIAPMMGTRPLPDSARTSDVAGDIARFRALYGRGIPGYDTLLQQFGVPQEMHASRSETEQPGRDSISGLPAGQP